MQNERIGWIVTDRERGFALFKNGVAVMLAVEHNPGAPVQFDPRTVIERDRENGEVARRAVRRQPGPGDRVHPQIRPCGNRLGPGRLRVSRHRGGD